MTNIAAGAIDAFPQFSLAEPPESETDGHRLNKKREFVHAPLSDGAAPRARRANENCRSIPTVIIGEGTLFRAGLIHLLAGTQFEVVADCPSLAAVPETLLDQDPALLLLGIDKEYDPTFAQMSRLRGNYKSLRIVMLRDSFNLEEALAAIGSGAHGYLVKDEVSPDMLLKSLELALLGAVVISRELAQSLANAGASCESVAASRTDCHQAAAERIQSVPAEPPLRATGLSGRERVILLHLMQGASNKHIARALGIAEATVKVHVKSLLRKTCVKNRTQAALWGINNYELTDVDQSKDHHPASDCVVGLG
jgi:two-component system, NarL family, nitrate/nitrite response regulator NarL